MGWSRRSLRDKHHPLRLELEAEIQRVGVSDDDQPYGAQLWKFSASPPTAEMSGTVYGGTTLGVAGDPQQWVESVKKMPDGAGPARFWEAICPRVPELSLWGELDRVGVSERLSPDQPVGFAAEDGHVSLFEVGPVEETVRRRRKVFDMRRPSGRAWEGSVEEELRRTESLSDDAGSDAFWARSARRT